jgi:hypothetical protein
VNIPRHSFPLASLLFGSYFHQDYEGAPEQVVTKFVQEQTKKQCEQTIVEIESILKQHPEEGALARIIDGEFGNCFDVLRFKACYRVWLQEIVETIRKECEPSSER